MASQAMTLLALVVLLFTGIARAKDASPLPSRKTAVVMPLLQHFSPRDGYERITQILGKEDLDVGNARRECFFRLEDSAGITVIASLDGQNVYSICHGKDVLYRSPQWINR